MKWLQDNPLGMALAGISGGLVLVAALLAIVWTLPVVPGTAGTATQQGTDTDTALNARPPGALSEFQVINEKPVFNESRLPTISALDGDELTADSTIEIKGAPDVRLTGVIITPDLRIASLTPKKDGQESLMAHEGEPLTGEFAGWEVSSVEPRNVVLESRDGQLLELDLEISDRTIKEPPKPEPAAITRPVAGTEAFAEDGEPLSRAEQIRERIAERRAELRRKQEDREAQGRRPQRKQPPGRQVPSQASRGQEYQNAIRALMGNNNKDKASDEDKDG